jgi:hypothetical protein
MASGSVAIVHADHVDLYLGLESFHGESRPVTVGSYPAFTVADNSSHKFVDRLHPVVG